MNHFEVWAPDAREVQVQVNDARHPMSAKAGGWWISDQPACPGDRYGFVLDGEGPFPDPRTLSQPDGVHGLSRVVDPAVFQRETSWHGCDVRGAVLYELHVGAFTQDGTLDAAIEHLDHLVALGVDAVELLPLSAFAGDRGWGYDGVAPWSVHESYGGQEALVRFVDAAHDRGLGVVLDIVFNHLGPEGNYLSRFGPYFTDRHTTPWGDAVNLDGEGSDEVRAYFTGSARHFLVDVGIDGLRLDAVHELVDESHPAYLVELAKSTAAWADETGRRLTLIAESDLNDPAMVSPAGSSPDARGMDAQWADDVHHALHAFFGRERQGYYVDFGTAEVLAKALTRVFVHDGGRSTFRGVDWGAPVDPTDDRYDGHSFVAFLQNHDQIGNRALGDRFGQHAGIDEQAAAASLYLLGAYTPMLFMGEEWAASTPFPYFSDLGPELGVHVTEGRKREFAEMGWDEETPDPQSEATFTSATLQWDERANDEHARMVEWYRHLIALRRAHREFRDPDLRSVTIEVIDDDTVAMQRGPFTVTATRADRLPDSSDEVLAAWGDVVRVTRRT